MKVLYIHHSGTYGGSSRSLGILLPHLENSGVELHIVCPQGRVEKYFRSFTPNVYVISDKELPLLMTVVGMSNNPFFWFRSWILSLLPNSLSKIIGEIKPDIVHCNELGLLTIAKMAFKSKIPLVMHARTMPHKDYPRLNSYAIKRINKYCKHLICISGSVHNAMSEVDEKSIIYNPIETIPTLNASKKKTKIVKFLSLSAIQKSKGVFDIAIAAKALKGHKNIKIQIAGRLNKLTYEQLNFKQKVLSFFNILDFSVTERFLDYIKTNDLSNLELLGHVDDVNQAVADADVVLAPMHLNAPPRSVYEAGIYSKPSILSMEDKVEDIIEDGVNGLLINEQAPDELIEAMLLLANDKELRDKLGRNGRERFIKNNNPKLVAEQIIEVYRKALWTKNSVFRTII